jgi:hypothetical protein
VALRDAHASEQFVHAEWLGEVVVGSGVERLDLVVFAPARRDHDDRYSAKPAQLFREVDPIHVG